MGVGQVGDLQKTNHECQERGIRGLFCWINLQRNEVTGMTRCFTVVIEDYNGYHHTDSVDVDYKIGLKPVDELPFNRLKDRLLLAMERTFGEGCTLIAIFPGKHRNLLD